MIYNNSIISIIITYITISRYVWFYNFNYLEESLKIPYLFLENSKKKKSVENNLK